MRSILDVCLCGAGKLLPRSYGVTATRCYSTNRNDHSSVIDYLSCNACGLRYDAKEEGESLYYLRQTAHRHAIELNQKPDQCVFCARSRQKRRSSATESHHREIRASIQNTPFARRATAHSEGFQLTRCSLRNTNSGSKTKRANSTT